MYEYMVYIRNKCYMFTYQDSLLSTMKPKERKKGKRIYIISLPYCHYLLLVFSPWAGLLRDQSSVRRLV